MKSVSFRKSAGKSVSSAGSSLSFRKSVGKSVAFRKKCREIMEISVIQKKVGKSVSSERT